MTWIVFNSVLSVFAAVFVAFKLGVYGDMLNLTERIGMGMMGASMLLTMAILWDVQKLGTPFDGWASSLFRIGLLVYLAGRMSRHIRHRKANREQLALAAEVHARRVARGKS